MGSYRKGAVFKPKDTSAGRFMGRSTIYGADGEHETPYMTRFWFGPLRLHIFHRGDADPDCHDHPWDFWTFPLRSYVEEVLEERVETKFLAAGGKTERSYFVRHTQVVKAFRLHYRPATHRHRVLGALTDWASFSGVLVPLYAPVGTIPTIVWRSGIKRKWGFTKSDDTGKWCWIPWKTYAYEGGKHAPCEDE
jgi:hypothetical protein